MSSTETIEIKVADSDKSEGERPSQEISEKKLLLKTMQKHLCEL